ncbi:MAG: 50S ribosomal protein L29 [Treponema sp.]|jgi:large subunit ribosomal protein L29|nr:50S ribosomal protein L29 [Treponema sp.]
MKNSFKNLSFQELTVKRDELSRKYMEFRFQMVIGHVENPLQKRTMRRQLARLNTLVRQHELGEAGKLNPNAVRKPLNTDTARK